MSAAKVPSAEPMSAGSNSVARSAAFSIVLRSAASPDPTDKSAADVAPPGISADPRSTRAWKLLKIKGSTKNAHGIAGTIEATSPVLVVKVPKCTGLMRR